MFDFSSWPGAILVIQPLKLAGFDTRKETAELLAPAVRGSVAALRAHATRWLQRSEAAESEAEKAAALAKSAEFQARVAELSKRLPGLPAITAEPQPEPEAQSDSEPQPEPEDEPARDDQPSPDDEGDTFNETGPKVTRQRVNVRQAA